MGHLAIWLDHREARVFHIDPEKAEEATFLAASEKTHHKHPRGQENEKAHPDDAKRFFTEISKSVAGTEAILVVGPSTAKLDFLRYLHTHDQATERRVAGVETVDHPTDKQLVAFAKTYFGLPTKHVA